MKITSAVQMNPNATACTGLNASLNTNSAIRNCRVGPIYCIIPMVESFSRLAARANRISGIAVIGPAASSRGMSEPPSPIQRPPACVVANQTSQSPAKGASSETSTRNPARLSIATFFRITP